MLIQSKFNNQNKIILEIKAIKLFKRSPDVRKWYNSTNNHRLKLKTIRNYSELNDNENTIYQNSQNSKQWLERWIYSLKY